MNKLVSFIRRKILRVPADRWDYQYQRGQWEGLEKEAARFDAVIWLISARYQKPAILEIGCGKALMFSRMSPSDYSRFTGVDLSEVAIAAARKFETEHIHFICADMTTYQPSEKFDVVAFNESLYYAKDPAAVFARYLPYLNEGGCIIVTAFDNKYTAKLWPAVDQKWKAAHSESVSADAHNWNVRLYQF